MASAGPAARKKASKSGLRGTRRRLSIVSDNKLIEGVATLGHKDEERTIAKQTEALVKAYAGRSKKGYAPYNPRKRNQDSLFMETDENTGTLLLGVLDGHGEAGDLVSQYFTSRLPSRLFAHAKWKSDPLKAMASELDKLEKSLLADASIDTDFSGTTFVACAIRKHKVYVANIGDSRLILGRKKGSKYEAVPVTDDHKPDRPDEQRRIEMRGGRVFAVEYEDGVDGPPRVWLGHMDIPGLAMARSLGDTVAHTAGVISEPECHIVDLGKDDKIMVLASDGLWEFISNQEVIDTISRFPNPKDAVDALIEEAGQRWMKEEAVVDDTTVILVYL